MADAHQDQPGNRSGGADINADTVNVGRDVVGRDKYEIHAAAGSKVIIGGREQPGEADAAVSQDEKAGSRLTETDIIHRRGIVAKANQLRQDSPNMKWKDIARELGVSERTLRDWRHNPLYQ